MALIFNGKKDGKIFRIFACDECNKELTYNIDVSAGKLKKSVHFCDRSCSGLYINRNTTETRKKEIQERRAKTNIKKYGHKVPAQNIEIQKQIQQERFEKTGYSHAFSNPEVRKKAEDTYYEKTGYKKSSENPEVRKKRKITYFNKTGYEFSAQNPEASEKRIKTNLKRYGHVVPASNPIIQNQIKQERFKKTGYYHQMQNPEIFKRARKTYFEKTGYEFPFQVPNVRKKVENDYFNKTGYLSPFFNPEIHRKSRETMKRTGVFKNFSKPEMAFKEALEQKYGKENIEHQKEENGWAIDLYIKNLDVYVQVDGIYWHGLIITHEKNDNKEIITNIKYTRNTDIRQNKWFPENSKKLFRITDKEVIKTKKLNCFEEIFNKIENL